MDGNCLGVNGVLKKTMDFFGMKDVRVETQETHQFYVNMRGKTFYVIPSMKNLIENIQGCLKETDSTENYYLNADSKTKDLRTLGILDNLDETGVKRIEAAENVLRDKNVKQLKSSFMKDKKLIEMAVSPLVPELLLPYERGGIWVSRKTDTKFDKNKDEYGIECDYKTKNFVTSTYSHGININKFKKFKLFDKNPVVNGLNENIERLAFYPKPEDSEEHFSLTLMDISEPKGKYPTEVYLRTRRDLKINKMEFESIIDAFL